MKMLFIPRRNTTQELHSY